MFLISLILFSYSFPNTGSSSSSIINFSSPSNYYYAGSWIDFSLAISTDRLEKAVLECDDDQKCASFKSVYML